jgi:hypothetical protein
VTEARDLLGAVPKDWALTETPLARHIAPLPPMQARAQFLHAFKLYTS